MELKIDGDPLKRFELVGEEPPPFHEWYDTAKETEKAYLAWHKIYEDRDERKLCPVRKLAIWDRGPENRRDQRKKITFTQLKELASQE